MKNAAGRKNRGFVSGKAAQTSRCRPLVGFLVVVALCAGFAQSGFASVVVYYDDPSSDGSSIMLANMCRNLVGHFDPQIQTVCLDAYQAGDMNAHDFVIYLGNDNVVNLFSREALDVATVFAVQAAMVLRNAILIRELQLSNESLTQQIERMNFGSLIGASPSMRAIFKKIDCWHPFVDVPALIKDY